MDNLSFNILGVTASQLTRACRRRPRYDGLFPRPGHMLSGLVSPHLSLVLSGLPLLRIQRHILYYHCVNVSSLCS